MDLNIVPFSDGERGQLFDCSEDRSMKTALLLEHRHHLYIQCIAMGKGSSNNHVRVNGIGRHTHLLYNIMEPALQWNL